MFQSIDQFIVDSFFSEKYLFDATQVLNEKYFHLQESHGEAILVVESISKQASDILS
jgi:hypothetical protein